MPGKKQTHFPPSDKKRGSDAPGDAPGWFFSAGPAPGVRMAGLNEYARPVAFWSSLSKWIIKKVK